FERGLIHFSARETSHNLAKEFTFLGDISCISFRCKIRSNPVASAKTFNEFMNVSGKQLQFITRKILDQTFIDDGQFLISAKRLDRITKLTQIKGIGLCYMIVAMVFK